MLKFTLIIFLLINTVFSFVFAESEILWFDDAEQGPGKWIKAKTTEITSEKKQHVFVLMPGDRMFSKEKFTLDNTKKYTLSCDVKSLGKKGNILLGFACFDKKGNEIPSAAVHYYPGTETTLIKTAYMGDTEIYIADGTKWETSKWACVAFDIDSSGKQKDIPNKKLNSLGITNVSKVDNGWKISLAKPLKKDWQSGTYVREHKNFTNRNFVYIQPQMPQKWKNIKGSCQGVARGNPRSGQWWPGTVEFRIFFMANILDGKEIYVDNFKLEIE